MEKCNFLQAKQFLGNFYTDKIKCSLEERKNLSEYETTLKEHLDIAYHEILNKNSIGKEEITLTMLRNSLGCLIFNEHHDSIMSKIYEIHKKEDEYLFQKCRSLCKKNVTVDHMGAPETCSIQFLAAVVELASLDCHKSPIEKLNCLQTTFDMIFAELKAAIIENISKFSEKENDIPVINNEDIIPVLMLVITKSKLPHFYSNLFYIEKFLWSINDINDASFSNLKSMYDTAVERLTNLDHLNTVSPDTLQNLDVTTYMTMSIEVETSKHVNKNSLLYQQKERIVNLIMASTNQ